MEAADVTALSAAEALSRWALEGLPRTDPHRPAMLANLAGILVKLAELTGADPGSEIVALAEEIAASDDRDPPWPVVAAAAASACLPVTARAHDPRLFDRMVTLLRRAVARLPDESAEKAGFLQSLGRAELTAWAFRNTVCRPDERGDTAAACLLSGDEARAVACLEGGRGVLLAKTLRDDRTLARLRDHDEGLADRFAPVRTLITGGVHE